jgi:hypothetical protein
VLTNRQRNGRVENIVRIVVPLGADEPLGVGAVALCRAFHLAFGEQIRISAGQCDAVKGAQRGLRPPLMPMPVTRLRAIGKGREDLDQHVITAKAEGRRRRRHTRSGAPKLVGNDGAAG